jgi:hypothetical protein
MFINPNPKGVTMSEILYSGIDLSIDEGRKEILIIPRGERFYFIPCNEQSKVFRNATLRLESRSGCYEIEGEQTLYTEHTGIGFDYEKLLCLHPAELIVKKSFLGLKWYSVSGIMKRDIRSRYRCQYKEYRIHERIAILSRTIEER